ncbi:MAG: sulfatase-like hydrolase/transferase [Rhodobacteraceae bacterium]|nr:sulfatase-like hydrolase/transferase [Paracoccaceae bacterium]
MARKPNFLFFMTDQHRFDWLGCTGHPVVRTPHIDSLAARGTLFDTFRVAMPVCMPNRASFMTGRYPSVHGLRSNGCALSPRANTFVEALAASGYRTAAIGKSHLQPMTDVPPPHDGPGSGPIAEAWKPETAPLDLELPGAYAGDENPILRAGESFYGYGHVDMVTGHGDRCGGHYAQWFRKTHPDWHALHDPANQLPHNYSCPQAYRTPVPEESYSTFWIANRASDWISAQAGEDDPFFAFVSFPDPHHPFNPPGRYWDMYSPDQFALDRPYASHSNPPPPIEALRARAMRGEQPPIPQAAIFLEEEQPLREAMALTAGMITMIDDAVGRVLAALEASGRAEDTVIVFNADHGDFLGDFNLLLKGPLPLRGLVQVPMIWSDPDSRRAATSSALASTIDLPATILDRAGIAPFWGMQGRSLMGCMDGSDALRDAVLVEHNDSDARMGFSTPARVRMLATDDWKLTLCLGEDWGELYDLRADPWEQNNLWDDPAHAATRATLTERLAHELTWNMDESPRALKMA